MVEELVKLFATLSSSPALITSVMAAISVVVAVYLKIRDSDVNGATSLNRAQNERLIALMDQNTHLLSSVAKLQEQVSELHEQISTDTLEHRKQIKEMYDITDEMRKEIRQLEDEIRTYKGACENCVNNH